MFCSFGIGFFQLCWAVGISFHFYFHLCFLTYRWFCSDFSSTVSLHCFFSSGVVPILCSDYWVCWLLGLRCLLIFLAVVFSVYLLLFYCGHSVLKCAIQRFL